MQQVAIQTFFNATFLAVAYPDSQQSTDYSHQLPVISYQSRKRDVPILARIVWEHEWNNVIQNKSIIFVLITNIQHYGNNINVLWNYHFNVLFGQ